MKVLKYAIGYIPINVIPALISVIATIVFTRIFPVSSYGYYSIAITILAPIIAFFSQIISEPLGRYLREYDNNNLITLAENIIDVAWTYIALLLLMLFVSIDVFSMLRLQSIFSLIIASELFIVSQLTDDVFLPILPIRFLVKDYRNISIGLHIVAFVLSLFLIVSFGPHISLVIWGSAISSFIAFPFILKKSQLVFRPTLRLSSSKHFWKFIKYGLPMALWTLVSIAMSSSDRLLVAIYLGPRAVAIYSVSNSLGGRMISLFSVPLVTALYPVLLSEMSQDNQSIQTSITDMTGILVIIGLAIVGLLKDLGMSTLLLLFGKPYQNGFIVLSLSATSSLLWGIGTLGHKNLQLTAQTRRILLNSVVALVINIFGGIILIPQFGLMGAPAALLLGYTYYTYATWRASKTSILWIIPWQTIISAFSSFVLATIVASLVSNNTSSPYLRPESAAFLFITTYSLVIVILVKTLNIKLVRNSAAEG